MNDTRLNVIIWYDEGDTIMPEDQWYVVGHQYIIKVDGENEIDNRAKYDGLTIEQALAYWQQLMGMPAVE